MQELTVEDARKTLGDLVTRVANDGERVVIAKNGIRAAQLVPATPGDIRQQAYEAAPLSAVVMTDPDEVTFRRTGQEMVMVYRGQERPLRTDQAGGEAAARIHLAWGPRA